MDENHVVVICSLLTVATLSAACTSHGDEAAAPERHLPSPVTVRLEASTPPTPLPDVGRVRDAEEVAGGWILLTGDAHLLWLLEGEVVRATGGKGDGPGEMRTPTALAAVADTLYAIDGVSGIVHLFDRAGDFLGRTSLPRDGCAGGLVTAAEPYEGSLALLRTCLSAGGVPSASVDLWHRDGSLLPLRRTSLWSPEGGFQPFRQPTLAAAGDDLFLGIAYDRCFRRISMSDSGERRLCPATEPRPPRDENEIQEARRYLAPRARRAGLRLDIPLAHPPFEGVMSVGARPAWVVHDRDGRAALDLLVDAGTVHRALLPADTRAFGGSGRILLVSDDLEGVRVQTVDYR